MTQQHLQSPSAKQAQTLIDKLVRFGRRQELLQPLDTDSARNALLDLFGFTQPYEEADEGAGPAGLAELLEPLLDYGYAIGLIPDNTTTYRDMLDARIMGLLMPRPSETAANFARTAQESGVKAATDAFYRLNIDSNYIRMDRIAKNKYWQQPTPYGDLEITINLSKPEKDPKEIALLKTLPKASYPKCLLCKENVGYAGRPDHPARQNLRVLPLKLRDEDWFFQYSPYVYYNEHSIIFKGAHEPMRISQLTFARLLDFVEQFPHYFIGSNADLPIVGGSILSHDHFQAGRHRFPMEKAPVEAEFTHPGHPGVSYGIVRWPMSVVRLSGSGKAAVLKAAGEILDSWRAYSDPEADIYAFSDQGDVKTPHNTITPIARIRDNGVYELDLVLRNNRTSDEHPDGIFHPHRHLHHIKKENIGLIEVMGLAVLPGRLKLELEQISDYLSGAVSYDARALADAAHPLHLHADWIAHLMEQFGAALAPDAALAAVENGAGAKFLEVLGDAGVYKRTEAGAQSFRRFMISLGLQAAVE
ncbi:UDP-glucose--hexose-1-phosphate uridylyltransferase [Paenibacillus beijingensis]|uniref:Galactose-1-phosphate uridylyltransferase n=1 Tax=Paenibacillus beijingensis TaxID=1126833 RepID=A0A0D5NL08_9BACL|nr:UDP-glucose--hexose-1-phosphate uridylyltransferase [Paenibacillus beijingensis]AJY75672.1 galactose-1-phosphate uridylyltransferase [Paenibacillus beijingensis]